MQHAEQRLRAALDDGDLDAIEFFSTLVDDLESKQRRPPPGLADAALWYASLGLHVFPLSPRSKMPRAGTHGLKDATTDQRLIASWWAVDEHANIGIATGHVVDVFDVDGLEGEQSLAALIGDAQPDVDVQLAADPLAERLLLSDVIGVVSTPRDGGRHLYVPAMGVGNRANLAPKVDIRGLGGYVVAPPSVTDVGTYEWVRLLVLPATT